MTARCTRLFQLGFQVLCSFADLAGCVGGGGGAGQL